MSTKAQDHQLERIALRYGRLRVEAHTTRQMSVRAGNHAYVIDPGGRVRATATPLHTYPDIAARTFARELNREFARELNREFARGDGGDDSVGEAPQASPTRGRPADVGPRRPFVPDLAQDYPR